MQVVSTHSQRLICVLFGLYLGGTGVTFVISDGCRLEEAKGQEGARSEAGLLGARRMSWRTGNGTVN